MIPLCSLDELLPGTARGFELNDKPVLVVRQGSNLYAYHNSCPHRGIRLEWQPDQFLDIDNHFIQCSTHGALFNIHDGLCIAGPCVGDALLPLACEVRDGQIWLQPE
nr:Rieske (2Fe-2S) protein [Oceanobacter mangrovi]